MSAKEEIKHLSELANAIRKNASINEVGELLTARHLRDYAAGIDRAVKEIAALNEINDSTLAAIIRLTP